MHDPYYRQGRDHRGGAPVGFADLRKRFGFRSIRLGRWVTAAERDASCLRFYDALCDLMDILRVPESVISLRGTLSLEYGTGGQPGVSAHYTPSSRAFALAKNAGPGSIAHEWFHAFDHYMVDKATQRAPSNWFASKAWLNNQAPVEHPLNACLFECFRVILLSEDGQSPSELFLRSVQVDRAQQALYFSLPEEVCARAFEAFVQDSSIKNRFLVKGTRQSDEARVGLYPEGRIRMRINEAFEHYFAALGEAVRRREAAGGYSQSSP